MFEYNQRTSDMKLTRGDSAYFDVELIDEDDSEYTLQSGDLLTFTVKNTTMSPCSVFSVSSSNASFHISPADTDKLRYGEYVYDIQLNTGQDVFTVVGPAVFELTEEVTW